MINRLKGFLCFITASVSNTSTRTENLEYSPVAQKHQLGSGWGGDSCLPPPLKGHSSCRVTIKVMGELFQRQCRGSQCVEQRMGFKLCLQKHIQSCIPIRKILRDGYYNSNSGAIRIDAPRS